MLVVSSVFIADGLDACDRIKARLFEYADKDDAMCSRQNDAYQQLIRARACIDECYDLPLDLI
jgi:hypothetical protein